MTYLGSTFTLLFLTLRYDKKIPTKDQKLFHLRK